MNQILQVEALLSILLKSFEVQVNTLHVLGRHQVRSNIAHHTMKLVEAVLNHIEKVEREFISEIEKQAEQILGESATLVNVLDEVRKDIPGVPALKELCSMVQVGHGNLTASLSKQEHEVIEEVVDRLAVMRVGFSTLLTSLEKM